MPRLIISRPWAASSVARASTAKAFSSPMRSKAATVLSMGAPPGVAGLRPRVERDLRSLMVIMAVPNEPEKDRGAPVGPCPKPADAPRTCRELRVQEAIITGPPDLIPTAEPDTRVAQDLRPDERIGIVAKIFPAVHAGPGREEV